MCVIPHHGDHPDHPRDGASTPDAPITAPTQGPSMAAPARALTRGTATSDTDAATTSTPNADAACQPRTSANPDPKTKRVSAPGGESGRERLHRPSLVFLLCATVLLGIAIPLCAHAETEHALALVATTAQLFDNIRNWLMGILAGLATVFFSVGGTRYLMAGGDPGEVEAAKRAFKAAAVGYCLAALAPLVLSILQQIIGAS